MARRSLDEILESRDEPEVEAAEVQAPVVENQPEVVEQPRDEHGKFAPKGVKEEAQAEPVQPDAGPPPADMLPKDVYAPLKAVRDENKALKDQLEALRLEIQQQQQPKEPPAPPPSVWDDEQAYGGHIVNTAVQQATLNARLDMSEMMVRQANPDFDDMKARFLQMAEANPTLAHQALSDPHPWNKAYLIAKNAAKMEALGAVDVDDLRAKMREELLAEMQAQMPAPAPNIPRSLSTARNVGSRTGPQWSGPTPLGDLIGN